MASGWIWSNPSGHLDTTTRRRTKSGDDGRRRMTSIPHHLTVHTYLTPPRQQEETRRQQKKKSSFFFFMILHRLSSRVSFFCALPVPSSFFNKKRMAEAFAQESPKGSRFGVVRRRLLRRCGGLWWWWLLLVVVGWGFQNVNDDIYFSDKKTSCSEFPSSRLS